MTADVIHLFDVVRIITKDVDGGPKEGDEGTVVDVLAPGVLEVEFSDEEGRAYAILPLRAEQLAVVYRTETRHSTTANRFEVYQDSRGQWRWQFKAPNGQTFAMSGTGYPSKDDAINSVEA
ncbi:MAG: DUF4926 domain-containing protein, partial [Dehalococcoidia bacterium]